jgi:putative zinc finger protein
VVKLRWGWGLSRREIASVLGVSEKVVKRDLEVSGRRLSEVVEELRSGRWCQRRRSLVTAYALELLSPSRAARAEAHLRACSGCRGLVHELRRRAEDVSGVAPAPVLAAPSMLRPLEAVGAALDSARTQLSDFVSGAKQQAVSLSVRATDPTPLAGARPGAVAAAVAGCLAAGTGAYCAVEGAVPEPLRFGPLAQERASADQPERSQRQPVASEPDPAPPVAAPPQAEPPVAEPPVAVAEPAPPASSAPSPESAPEPEPSKDFFGSESAGARPPSMRLNGTTDATPPDRREPTFRPAV